MAYSELCCERRIPSLATSAQASRTNRREDGLYDFAEVFLADSSASILQTTGSKHDNKKMKLTR